MCDNIYAFMLNYYYLQGCIKEHFLKMSSGIRLPVLNPSYSTYCLTLGNLFNLNMPKMDNMSISLSIVSLVASTVPGTQEVSNETCSVTDRVNEVMIFMKIS